MSVYFIKSKDNEFKIGSSITPQKRLATLQTGNANILSIYKQFDCENYQDVEKKLHLYFKDKRIRNSEWFNICEKEINDILDIMNICSSLPKQIDNSSVPQLETAEECEKYLTKESVIIYHPSRERYVVYNSYLHAEIYLTSEDKEIILPNQLHVTIIFTKFKKIKEAIQLGYELYYDDLNPGYYCGVKFFLVNYDHTTRKYFLIFPYRSTILDTKKYVYGEHTFPDSLIYDNISNKIHQQETNITIDNPKFNRTMTLVDVSGDLCDKILQKYIYVHNTIELMMRNIPSRSIIVINLGTKKITSYGNKHPLLKNKSYQYDL